MSDVDEAAEKAFRLNYPEAPYLRSDVRDLEAKQILSIADGRRIHGVLGGPPCQGFSLAGLKRDDATFNDLVWQHLRLVKQLDPDFLLLENVPQFLFNRRFRELVDHLSRSYLITYGVLNAALYGAPQTRHRGFFLAFHRRLSLRPSLPSPTHSPVGQQLFNYKSEKLTRIESEGNLSEALEVLGGDPLVTRLYRDQGLDWEALSAAGLKPLVTVEDALSDLRPTESDPTADAVTRPYSTEPQTERQRNCREESEGAANHNPRKHSERALRLIRQIPEGGDLRDAPRELWPKSHYSQAYGRLHRRGLARTITTFFSNPGSGRFLHYAEDRAITVREAARLQGFSDTFLFPGSQQDQMRLVGNAVPLPLAEALAVSISRAMGGRPPALTSPLALINV